MAAHFLLQIFQRFTQHIGHNADAGYHKQKVRHGFHLLSTEVLRNSVQPAATQWSAFHCRQTKLNHIYCCPSILFHTVNEHIRIFVQIPITGAADSFSHGCAVPDLRRFACLLPAQRAANSTPSKRKFQTVDKKLFSPQRGRIALSADERIAEFLDFAIQAKFAYVNKLRRASRARYRSTERLTSLCWRSFSSSLQRILRTIHPDRRTSRRAYPSAEAERRQTPPCQSARAERRPF